MSIISTTNSTCTIKRIEYKGVEAIVYLNIVAFAKTYPLKGVMIYLKESNNSSLIPAFRVSSEDDVYQNKIFWINSSTLKGHTHQNVGMDATIPVHVDLSKGTYKNGHLYRNVTIVITDYENTSKYLWASEQLNLCSGPLKFDIVGNIIPSFTKLNKDDGTVRYGLSVDYTFSETSWLFNLKHEDITIEMSVAAKQSSEFEIKKVILANVYGSWNDISNELEETAHVTITTKLKLNNSVIWQDQITCVPGEVSILYVKKNNSIYIVSHKALQKDALTRDIHVYHNIEMPCELCLIINPWTYDNGTQHIGNNGQPLYTVEPYISTISGKYTPLNYLLTDLISISEIYFDYTDMLLIPDNLTGNIRDDVPTVIYHNFEVDIAERILSQMALLTTTLKINVKGVSAVKQPILCVSESPSNYLIGANTTSDIYVGTETGNDSLLIQKGDKSYGE